MSCNIIVDRGEKECVICFEDLQGEHLRPCLHPVHHHCFKKTFKNICPMCRQIVIYPHLRSQHALLHLDVFALVVVLLITVVYFVVVFLYEPHKN